MIPVVIALLGVAAVGAGTAAGRWAYRRVRRSQARSRVEESAPVDPHANDPIAIGDVVMLEGGRGEELWLVRRLAFTESDGDPFLVVFEAYPRAAATHAILAWDPLRPERIDLLGPAQLEEAAVLAHSRQSRPPSTLDVPIDDGRERVQLVMRRIAKAELVTSPDAEGRSDLPAGGDAVLVARYSGGADVRALVVRDGAGALFTYAGRAIALDENAVLHNRAAAP